jgi:hypothetical protein
MSVETAMVQRRIAGHVESNKDVAANDISKGIGCQYGTH